MAKDEQDGQAEGAQSQSTSRQDDATSPLEDLSGGLDLMLRAAKKALRGLDAGRIEEISRRAKSSLEQMDREKVRDIGRRAVQTLDPKKVEEIANDVGQELLNVVERLAERVDGMMGRGRGKPSESPSTEQRSSAESDSAPASRVAEAPTNSKPKVRVGD